MYFFVWRILLPIVLIIGASRGIGLGFAQVYAALGWKVHATTRNINNPGKLGMIAGDISLHELDVINTDHINRLAANFQKQSIDLLIHNAGVYGTNMNSEIVIKINSEAPFNVINKLMPSIEISNQKKIAILTSKMGARNGGPTPSGLYGSSKAFLNDRYRETSGKWTEQGIKSVIFHPGWVNTDMGGASAPISVTDSVNGMNKVIENLKLSNSGKFMNWQGNEISW